MPLSCWCYLLACFMGAIGLVSLAAPGVASKAFAAFPRNRWAGYVLSAVAWVWSAYAVSRMGLDFLEPYKKFVPYIALACIPLTWWALENLLPCRAWGGILCLFPYGLLHATRLNDSPWRLVVVVFAYLCIIKGMILILYPWKERQLIAYATATPSRFRVFALSNLVLGAVFAVLGATVLK